MSDNIKERELKMVKKSLFLIALTILVSTSMLAAQVEGPIPQSNGTLKTDDSWPYKTIITYEVPTSDLCVMDVEIKIGWYIEIINCNQKILLEQVSCSDLVKSNPAFPCYAGCRQIGIQSNFAAILGLKFAKVGDYADIINGNNWDVYFSETNIDSSSWDETGVSDTWEYPAAVALGARENVWVCVEIWDANVWLLPADTQGQCGQVTITVRPTDAEIGI